MPDVTIVYWRDIPAQVIVGPGRRGAKAPLPERFEQAIDRAAMKVGASDTDAYLAEWRKGEPYQIEGDAAEIVAAEVARIDREYDKERLIALIANDGRA
ncbi:MAG: virulence factor [Marivivens sp.]|jgi:hypothetical protein